VSNATKIAVPLLLLAAVAAFAIFKWSQSTIDLPVPVPAPIPTAEQPKEQPKQDPVTAPVTVTVPTKQDPVRVEVKPLDTNSHTDAPQGVKGRVLQTNGAPAGKVPVYLMENSMNDPIKIFLQNKSGLRTPPTSSGLTADDGTFALGVLQPGKSYDLRVVSDDNPEINHQQIKVREDDWVDTGDLTLEVGLVVSGRVLEEATKAGVPNATVFLANSNEAHAMIATPGRERGIVALTDASGNFRFGNAPRQGLINLEVEAVGFASSQLQNQQLTPDGVNEYTLEVVRGQPIAGVVVDRDGKPLNGITLTASGLSAKTPQVATTASMADGTFVFESLREGPYQLVSNSTQYMETKTPPVMTGDMEVKVVLTPRAYAKLRVFGANKQPVKAYSLSLKRYFPNNALGIGNVPEFPDRRINPSDYPAEFGGEWAVVRGLPPGEFVFQIQDSQHAKSLSAPFKVTEGDAAAEVEAILTLGATITGTVIDDNGRPVAGATITTDMNGGFAADTGFFEIFRQFIPEKHSKASTKSDSQGRFRIAKLAFADYMVRIAHPDFCEGSALDLKLETEGQVVDVGTIQLSRGAIIEGVTTIGGFAAGQVKVSVQAPQTEVAPRAQPAPAGQAAPAPRMMFSASVVSDNDGRFRLLKRVPPGVYDVTASRASGNNNPFEVLIDMKESKQQLVVSPGQDRIQLSFNLSKR
jgi:uncharacterized GH25 family protein